MSLSLKIYNDVDKFINNNLLQNTEYKLGFNYSERNAYRMVNRNNVENYYEFDYIQIINNSILYLRSKTSGSYCLFYKLNRKRIIDNILEE